jgi:adenosylcobinamide amidohydrolase
MEYAQFIALEESGIGVLAVVTAGISNALNITERSDTEFSGEAGNAPGTINIIAVTNGCLLDECMVSSMITATEAKTAALMELGVRSVVSGTQATGTGTDTVVVVSGNGANIRYAGGHTLYGQLLGEAVYLGVKRSLQEIASGIGSFESLYTLFNF